MNKLIINIRHKSAMVMPGYEAQRATTHEEGVTYRELKLGLFDWGGLAKAAVLRVLTVLHIPHAALLAHTQLVLLPHVVPLQGKRER